MCMYVCTYICLWAKARAARPPIEDMHKFPYICICINVCTYTYIYVCWRKARASPLYMCIYIYIYMYIYVYIHIYIHTHISIYTHIHVNIYVHMYVSTKCTGSCAQIKAMNRKQTQQIQTIQGTKENAWVASQSLPRTPSRLYICTYIYIYVHIYIHLCTYMYIYMLIINCDTQHRLDCCVS